MSLLATAPPRRDCPAPVEDPALVSTLVPPTPSAWPSRPQPLANRTVLLAVRAADRSEAIAAFSAAGAVVRAVTDLASLRRDAALIGPQALVVADLRAVGDQLRTSLPALARQDAVVVLAGTLTSAERVACLRDGADHVCHSGRWLEVVTLLAAVLRRSSSTPPPPRSRSVGDITVDLQTRVAHVDGRLLALTALEFGLLAYFAAHPHVVLSRETLLAHVWGYEVGGLDTVTVHVRRLRCKLEPDPSRPCYIQTVWGRGYRLTPSGVSLDAAQSAGSLDGATG